jgi:hypothetical protein
MQIQYCTYAELAQMVDGSQSCDGVMMVMPFTNAQFAAQAAKTMATRAGSAGMIWAILDAQREGFVKVVNTAFAKSTSPWFGYVAQDAFAGRAWLTLALDALGDQKHFLGFNDGKWAGALAGFGLARRTWAQQNYPELGHSFFYPQYVSHYADAELTLLALQAGVYAYEPNSVLVEVDWEKDQATVNEDDRAHFAKRKAHGFDGKVQQAVLLDLIA